MNSDPFKDRKKTYTGETVAEVKTAILTHRQEVHKTSDVDEFFDCAACGIYERRLASLEALQRKDGVHPEGCDCAIHWEPKPGPGQTMDQVLRAELAKELRLMDDGHLGLMIEMVAFEQQRRHPMPAIERLSSADLGSVKELVKIMVDAFNERMDREPPVDFVDAFMALVNFDRLVLEMIEQQAEMTTFDQKRAFRSAFVATVSQSLMKRVTN